MRLSASSSVPSVRRRTHSQEARRHGLTPINLPLHLSLGGPGDVITARRGGREYATRMGFGAVDRAMIAAVISEIARSFAVETTPGRADLSIRVVEAENELGQSQRGIQMEACGGACDSATQRGSGQGRSLTVVRRFTDELQLSTSPSGETRLRATKWLR